MAEVKPAFFKFSTKEAQIAAAREMNMFSNVFMSVALDDIPSCTYVLRILTRISDLEVVEVRSQEHIAKLVSRDVILGIIARDSEVRFYNIEIQRADTIDHRRRVRLYRSEIDSELLRKGTDVDALPELYVIYISETDIFESGLAWDEVIQKFRRAGTDYDDGCHIIYANAEVDEGDQISELMRYFKSADPDDMNHGELSKRLHFMKREAGGEVILCKIAEGFIKEGKREGKLEIILSVMKKHNWNAEQTMEFLDIEREDRPTYAAFVKTAVGSTPPAPA